MRQVLFELMEETPKDLLSLNLYLSSKTADEWYQLTSNLTRSIAVMSVIGYVIGKFLTRVTQPPEKEWYILFHLITVVFFIALIV